MGGDMEALLKRVQEVDGDRQIRQLVDDLSEALINNPVNIKLLEARAVLYTKLQLFGPAINDYRMVLQLDKTNSEAAVQIEQLSTILRFSNTDIFENPNTTFDPWLE